MILNEVRVMRGPNMWSANYKRLTALKLDYTNLDQVKIDKVLKWFKENVDDLTTSFDHQDGLMQLTSVIANLTKFLQPHSNRLHAFTKLLGERSYYAITEYEVEDAGVKAAERACEIIEKIVSDELIDSLENIKQQVAAFHKGDFLGPSTSTIVEAAIRRNIPVRKCPGGLIAFGQGAYQKKISASISENTSDISVDIASDKETTKQILQEAFIPVPKGYVVREEASLEELLPRLQYPLVVKPLNANQGKGITSNIQNAGDLKTAFSFAKRYSNSIIIEKHIQGNDYRFLVIGHKLVAAAQRIAACVKGNGVSTISQLIDEINQNPKRGEGHGSMLTKISLDESSLNILKAKNLSPDSVLEKDRIVFLKDTANLSTGGTAIDVTDTVHPDNILLAERVSKLIGLDICGIDIMAPDVTSPINENGGAVLEVNAAPGLRMHVAPSEGQARNIGDPIIEMLYPSGNKFRIPIVAVTGTNGKTTTSRLMAHLAMKSGYDVGFTTTDGIYINDTRIYKGDCSGPQSAKMILQEPSVNFAVLECARGGIIRSGLAFDQCDIAIVTNVAADHLGLKDIYTVEDLAAVKAVVPQSVSRNGYAILNACDALVYNMKKDLNCKVALFSIDPGNLHVKEHCKYGGYAILLNENKEIEILQGNERIYVCSVLDIPLTMNGKAEFMIENVLPVVLGAYLLGMPIVQIRNSLQTFKPSFEQTPGRLNTLELRGRTILLDYAHNPHGLKALAKYLATIDHHIIGIITGVGDRRDKDLMEIGKVAAEMFDEVIIRFDKDMRGRSHNEMAELIIQGLEEVKPTINYKVIGDSKAALHHAIENSDEGSYIVISADDTTDTINLLKELNTYYSLTV